MDKNIKSAIIVLAVAAAVFMLISWNKKPKTALKEEEKAQLFSDAMGYRGGAAPAPEVEEAAKVKKEEALKKISELGLQAEFDNFMKNQSQMDYPSVSAGSISGDII